MTKNLIEELKSKGTNLSPEAEAVILQYQDDMLKLNLTQLNAKTKECEAKLKAKKDKKLEAAIDKMVGDIKVRTRYELFNDVVGEIVAKPDKPEIVAAIFDGLSDINSFEPETGYGLESIMDNPDTRWHRLLTIAASKNFVLTLIFDWTANGLGPKIEDLEIESKLQDWKDLYQLLSDQFKEQAERLKLTALKVVRGTAFGTTSRTRVVTQSSLAFSASRRAYNSLSSGFRR